MFIQKSGSAFVLPSPILKSQKARMVIELDTFYGAHQRVFCQIHRFFACLALSKKGNKLDPASLYGFVALAIRLPELFDAVLEQGFDSLSGHATVYMI